MVKQKKTTSLDIALKNMTQDYSVTQKANVTP